MAVALLMLILNTQLPAPAQLAAEADRAYAALDFALSAERYAQLAKMRPDDAGVLFNWACALAMDGQVEASLDALERSVGSGFAFADYLDATPALGSVRAHPRYLPLLEQARGHQVALKERRARADGAVRAAEEAIARADWAGAEAALRETSVADAPEPTRMLFLSACAQAGGGDPEAALRTLRQALVEGFVDLEAARSAQALVSVRRTTGWKALERELGAARKELLAASRAALVVRGRGRAVVALHGYGQEPVGFGEQVHDTLSFARVLAVRGPVALESGGYGWVDLQRTRAAVQPALLRRARGEHPILLGFSQGGWLGLRLALAEPRRFGGAIIIGTSRFEPPDEMTLARVARSKLRIALLAGEGDPAAVAAAQRAERTLADAGIPVRVWLVPELGHQLISGAPLKEAFDFITAGSNAKVAR